MKKLCLYSLLALGFVCSVNNVVEGQAANQSANDKQTREYIYQNALFQMIAPIHKKFTDQNKSYQKHVRSIFVLRSENSEDKNYIDGLVECFCKAYQEIPNSNEIVFDVAPLENHILKKVPLVMIQKRLVERGRIIINPKDLGPEALREPKTQLFLKACQEVATNSAKRIKELEAQREPGQKSDQEFGEEISQEGCAIVLKAMEGFSVNIRENQSRLLPLSNIPQNLVTNKQKAELSQPKQAPQQSSWKRSFLTVVGTCAATLGAAYALLKVSGYSLVKLPKK